MELSGEHWAGEVESALREKPERRGVGTAMAPRCMGRRRCFAGRAAPSCFQRSRGGPEVPPRASQIEGKGGHHFDDRTLGTPRKSQCKVCVCAPAGHFLGLVLMTSLSGGSVRVRVGFCISLGGGPWEAVGVCDHPAGTVRFRGPGQFCGPGSMVSGGLLGVVFHVVPIVLSALCAQAERGHVAAWIEPLNATCCAEGALRSCFQRPWLDL